MSPRVVTGASGLLGRAVFDRLSDAVGVARSVRVDGRWISADLTDPEGARQIAALDPDLIVHLAGSTNGDDRELQRANVESTRVLLQTVGELGLRPYVIVAGSAAEYGEPDGWLVDEESPIAPLSAYGRIKAEQSRVAQEEAARARIPLTIVRPFNVVSPVLPQSSALGNFRRQLLDQEGSPRTLRCGRLDIVRDYVTSEFVATAIARLADGDYRPAVLNVCSGIGIELRAIVAAAADILGIKLEIAEVPELVRIAAARRVVGNPGRLARLGLSFDPTPASLAAELLR